MINTVEWKVHVKKTLNRAQGTHGTPSRGPVYTLWESKEEKRAERVFEEIMAAESLPNCQKDMYIKFQMVSKFQVRWSQRDPLGDTLHPDFQDKERAVKAARDNRVLTSKRGHPVRLSADLSSETSVSAKVYQYGQSCKKKNRSAENPLSSKTMQQSERETKMWPDRQSSGCRVPTEPLLQELLLGVGRAQGKDRRQSWEAVHGGRSQGRLTRGQL